LSEANNNNTSTVFYCIVLNDVDRYGGSVCGMEKFVTKDQAGKYDVSGISI